MNETHILAAIRYPVQEHVGRTLQKAIELSEGRENADLTILHVNSLHKNEGVSQQALIDAVENEFGSLANATYSVINAFLVEEAILHESIQQEAEYVVIGEDTRAQWRQILTHRLQMDVNIEAFLEQHLDANLVVV